MPNCRMSGNKAAEQIIQWGRSYWMETCFDRAQALKPCPSGATGACCRICHMGPCRFVHSSEERVEKGICGARLATVVARNFLRMAAAGVAAHSDHARELAIMLLRVARGEITGFDIRDTKKLHRMAGILGIEVDGRDKYDLAEEVAERLIEDFTRQWGILNYIKRVPEKTRERWERWDIVPVGIDREIAEALHRTNIGVDHDPDTLLLGALRVSLADGWGGSMIASDITDILFGTPNPDKTEAGFGIFRDDHVNLLVIGHNPALTKTLMDVISEPDIIEYARSKGAQGITLGDIFGMQQGVPTAGGFTNQELCLIMGIIDAAVVDRQCIMPTLADLAYNFHTKVITTSRKAHIQGVLHMPFDLDKTGETARGIVTLAIDNYPNRTGMGEKVKDRAVVLSGFSLESLENMNGDMRFSFSHLNNAIAEGKIRGLVGLVGCDNPRVQATGVHTCLAKELVKDDLLILTTECGAAACAVSGLLDPENILKEAGPGLRKTCEEMAIPPILHLGGCNDNSRILNILSAIVSEGGLSDEIGGLPVVIIAPEWMAEKEIAVGCYFAASGIPVIMGGTSPVEASEDVARIMTEIWYERFKGALHFEPDYERMYDMVIEYIDRAREELNLKAYEFGA